MSLVYLLAALISDEMSKNLYHSDFLQMQNFVFYEKKIQQIFNIDFSSNAKASILARTHEKLIKNRS